MARTLMTMTGEHFLVKNTFIDGPACDVDEVINEMRKLRSEPNPRRPSFDECEKESRPRSHSDVQVIVFAPDANWGIASAPIMSFESVSAPRKLSSASTRTFASSDSEPHYPDSDLSDGSSQLGSVAQPSAEQLPEDDPTQTTILAKNFPASYTKSMVLDLLDANGYNGKYNFVYLPVDFATQRSFGYAFLNFVTHQDAIQFRKMFTDFSNWVVCSTKVGTAEWSGALQGFEKHVERYRDSPMMHKALPDDVKPSIFKNGGRIAFPPPTKVLKVPRRVNRKPHSSSLDVTATPPRWSGSSADGCGKPARKAPSAQRLAHP